MPSSSELLASRLAPCTPLHATSPTACSQGSEVAQLVDGDPCHVEARRRCHRQAHFARIETVGQARGQHGREALREVVDAARVQPCAAFIACLDDAAGDDVARRK